MSVDKLIVRNRYHHAETAAEGFTCIYKLKDYKGRCMYVGQSKNLRSRISSHRANMVIHGFEYYLWPDADANNEEARAIISSAPTENATLPSNNIFVSKKVAREILLGVFVEEIFDSLKVFQGRGEHKLQYVERRDVEKLSRQLYRVATKDKDIEDSKKCN